MRWLRGARGVDGTTLGELRDEAAGDRGVEERVTVPRPPGRPRSSVSRAASLSRKPEAPARRAS